MVFISSTPSNGNGGGGMEDDFMQLLADLANANGPGPLGQGEWATTAVTALAAGDIEQTSLVQIGHGGFSTVFSCRTTVGGKAFALKVMKSADIEATKKSAQVLQEIVIHKQLDHANIAKLHCFWADVVSVNMVMDLGKLDLHQALYGGNGSTGTSMAEPSARKAVKHVASALSYLHTNNVVHRDLKLENIVLGYDNAWKLIDFGASAATSAQNGGRLYTMCGTCECLAPEMLYVSQDGKRCTHGYTQAVDMWASGVMLFELLTGSPPFIFPGDFKGFQDAIAK